MIRFEPGDATSYLVDFRHLTREEARAVGGFGPENNPVLFSFCAGDGPLVTMYFQGADHGAIHIDYFMEKMYRFSTGNQWTMLAAFIVFSYLSARSMLDPNSSTNQVLGDWEPGWPMLLNALYTDASIPTS